jgi:hypothetical protein
MLLDDKWFKLAQPVTRNSDFLFTVLFAHDGFTAFAVPAVSR